MHAGICDKMEQLFPIEKFPEIHIKIFGFFSKWKATLICWGYEQKSFFFQSSVLFQQLRCCLSHYCVHRIDLVPVSHVMNMVSLAEFSSYTILVEGVKEVLYH